jgi:hypothetical protein
VWSIFIRKKQLLIFILWWLVIILATNLDWFGLPSSETITNFAVLIAFYIPAGIILGSVVGFIFQSEKSRNIFYQKFRRALLQRMVLPALLLIIISVIGLNGATDRVRDLDLTAHALVTRPDLRAMDWIRENTPPDSKFLVNAFSAYNGSLEVGSDAGWWIPILAKRASVLPPITYGFESGTNTASLIQINQIFMEIQNEGITNPDIISMLHEQGVEYLYIGQRHGSVNNPGPVILEPQVIEKDPNYKAIYHQDRVWIFELKQ